MRRGAGQPRTIVEPIDPATRAEGDEVEIPLIGQIAVGVPLDAVELAEETFLLLRRLGRPRGPVHAAGQGGLDDRGGDHRR